MSIPINNDNSQKLLQRKVFKRMQRDEALESQKEQDKEISDPLFFSAAGAATTAVGEHSNFGVPLSEQKLGDLPFLKQRDMGVMIEVVLAKLVAENPMLESIADHLYTKLDALLENAEGELNPESDELDGLLDGALASGLSNFEVYAALYEYYLRKKRAKANADVLKKLKAKLDGFEDTATLEIIQNFKKFNQATSDKFKLINEFKSRANSYHGEYAEIIQMVVKQYAGNFRAMLGELFKLCGANTSSSLAPDSSRTFENQAQLLESVYLETKLLNLTSLLCKLEQTGAKLIPLLPSCNALQLTNDLIDLLDGFDCSRLVNTKCKTITDPEQKKALTIRLININIEIARYLPSNFFKKEQDRENLSQRLKDSTILKSELKKGVKPYI